MTLPQVLVFAGGVLGPALVAQEVARMLRAIPQLGPARPQPLAPDVADALLRRAFPDGLPL